MLFTSYGFLAFVGILILFYYLVPPKMQWMLLLLASYIFYSLAGVEYLAFIFSQTIISFFTAKIISNMLANENKYIDENRAFLSKEERKAYRTTAKKKRFKILIVGIIFGFGILAVIKYTSFAVTNVNSVIGLFGIKEINVPELLMPLGISFYTFQSMGYVIDVYRNKAKAENNIARYALFVSFFPQLIQGPISRFQDLGEQLITPHIFDKKNLFHGFYRIAWGYFKKLVVADRMLIAVKTIIDDPDKYDGVYVFLLIIFYSIQIYADFTGGIDITIGLAKSLGISVKENFDHPYFSKSTKEYWRRWHITMGTWFSDYIFYPLSVSKPMQTLSKKSRATFGNALGKRIPVYVATLITWFLTGLWHGAGWNFIVWGLLNAMVILISQELAPIYDTFRKKFSRITSSSAYSVFMMVRTFFLMSSIRILDCYRDVPLTFKMFTSIFTVSNIKELFGVTTSSLGLTIADFIVILLGCCLMFIVSFLQIKKGSICTFFDKHTTIGVFAFCSMIFVIIIFGAYGIGYDSSQFIYNQF